VNLCIVTDQELALIANVRDRVQRCRRLAAATTDRRAAEILLQMADEGEADLARLRADEAIKPEGPAKAE
jgi:hypothetical protein